MLKKNHRNRVGDGIRTRSTTLARSRAAVDTSPTGIDIRVVRATLAALSCNVVVGTGGFEPPPSRFRSGPSDQADVRPVFRDGVTRFTKALRLSQESNLMPPTSHAGALSVELQRQVIAWIDRDSNPDHPPCKGGMFPINTIDPGARPGAVVGRPDRPHAADRAFSPYGVPGSGASQCRDQQLFPIGNGFRSRLVCMSTVEFSIRARLGHVLRPWAGFSQGWKESNPLAPVLEAGLLPSDHPLADRGVVRLRM